MYLHKHGDSDECNSCLYQETEAMIVIMSYLVNLWGLSLTGEKYKVVEIRKVDDVTKNMQK